MEKLVRMVVLHRLEYRQRWREPGDVFDAEPGHVQLFEVLGWARKADEDEGDRKAQSYQTRHLESEKVNGADRRQARIVRGKAH